MLAIQAIRSWIQAYPLVRTGWIAALQDPKIGRAIALIHQDPGRAWTLAEVAREVAMSRSAFAARFSELVGEPMMHYLTRWRMHVALESLRQNGTPVAEVAERLGYRSKAAFSRAFKRVVTTSPGAVRRRRSAQIAGDNPRPRQRVAENLGVAEGFTRRPAVRIAPRDRRVLCAEIAEVVELADHEFASARSHQRAAHDPRDGIAQRRDVQNPESCIDPPGSPNGPCTIAVSPSDRSTRAARALG